MYVRYMLVWMRECMDVCIHICKHVHITSIPWRNLKKEHGNWRISDSSANVRNGFVSDTDESDRTTRSCSLWNYKEDICFCMNVLHIKRREMTHDSAAYCPRDGGNWRKFKWELSELRIQSSVPDTSASHHFKLIRLKIIIINNKNNDDDSRTSTTCSGRSV
jgi:hypothetical protein